MISLSRKNIYYVSFKDVSMFTESLIIFSYLCGVEVDGFRDGVKHVRHAHPETLIEDKACPCIICPKRFGRMDHLKNHVYAHGE